MVPLLEGTGSSHGGGSPRSRKKTCHCSSRRGLREAVTLLSLSCSSVAWDVICLVLKGCRDNQITRPLQSARYKYSEDSSWSFLTLWTIFIFFSITIRRSRETGLGERRLAFEARLP